METRIISPIKAIRKKCLECSNMCEAEKTTDDSQDEVFKARIHDAFHDIKLGAGEIHILCKMCENEIPDLIETDTVAFREITELIAKDSLKWLSSGLRYLAMFHPHLDYKKFSKEPQPET